MGGGNLEWQVMYKHTHPLKVSNLGVGVGEGLAGSFLAP